MAVGHRKDSSIERPVDLGSKEIWAETYSGISRETISHSFYTKWRLVYLFDDDDDRLDDGHCEDDDHDHDDDKEEEEDSDDHVDDDVNDDDEEEQAENEEDDEDNNTVYHNVYDGTSDVRDHEDDNDDPNDEGDNGNDGNRYQTVPNEEEGNHPEAEGEDGEVLCK